MARVTGFLTKRLFTEGDEVKPGDLLYQIEKPPFEADVQAKTAVVAQANAQLQNASITLGRARLAAEHAGGAALDRGRRDGEPAVAGGDAAGGAGQSADVADQPGLHRHLGADRGQDRPHGADDRQRGRAVQRHAGHDRQPGPDVRVFPGRRPRGDRVAGPLRGQGRHVRGHHQAAAAERQGLRAERSYRLHRPDRGRQHRHDQPARRDRQPAASRAPSRARRATGSWWTASS